MKVNRLTPLALALSLCGPAPVRADAETAAPSAEALELVRPVSSLRVGGYRVMGEPARFGEFTGATEVGGVPLLNVDLLARDEKSGTWRHFHVRDLELDARHVRFEHGRQGHWEYFIDHERLPHAYPHRATTALGGVGERDQLVAGETPRVLALSSRRDNLTVGWQLSPVPLFDTRVRFRREKNVGARPFSKDGPNFITEPLNAVHQEAEATVGYAGKQLQVQAGYLGSWYRNENKHMTSDGQAIDDTGSPSQISLPFDNEAHQLFVFGGFGLSPTGRLNFKVSREQARQDGEFFALTRGAAFGTATSLGGKVDTTIAQLGLTARPAKNVSTLVELRYEDRDDRTPVRQYLSVSDTLPHGLNQRYPRTVVNGRAEATVHLTGEDSLSLGGDQERKRRAAPASVPYTAPDRPAQARQAVFREETVETGYRIEYRRSLSERLNGALTHVASEREGSRLLVADDAPPVGFSPPVPDLVVPVHWSDAKRSRWRLSLDWLPVEFVSLQTVIEDANTRYSGLALGPRSGVSRLFSLDAGVTLSKDWQVSAWFAHNESSAGQRTCGAITRNSYCLVANSWLQWSALIEERGDAVGMGLRGSPTRKVKVGLDAQHLKERNDFTVEKIDASSPVLALPAALPKPIHYTTTQFSAFFDYALSATEGWRVDGVFQRQRTDDWTWDLLGANGRSLYADGTAVTLEKDLKAGYVGASYYRRW